MKSRRPKHKAQAIALRKQGYSYNEICEMIEISKSTCSLWLKGIKLNKEAIHRLVQRQDKARQKSHLTLRQYGKERDEFIRQKVTKLFNKFTFTPEIGKLLCAALYWGEGAKDGKSLNFTNSDPDMIRVYLNLLRNYFDIDNTKFRVQIHLHSYHDVKKQRQFWSKITNVPQERISIYQKQNSGKNIKVDYPGCVSVRYYDIRLAKEVQFIYNSLVGIYGGVV